MYLLSQAMLSPSAHEKDWGQRLNGAPLDCSGLQKVQATAQGQAGSFKYFSRKFISVKQKPEIGNKFIPRLMEASALSALGRDKKLSSTASNTERKWSSTSAGQGQVILAQHQTSHRYNKEPGGEGKAQELDGPGHRKSFRLRSMSS